MFGRLGGDRRVILVAFGVSSLIAVAVGAWVCARHGVPARLWGLNLAAWMVGAVAAVLIGGATAARRGWVVVYVTPFLLAASLAFPGRDGVHRWVSAGPLQVNIAMLILPMFVVALAATRSGQPGRWLAALACLLVLGLQPDASQATALGLALTVILGGEAVAPRWRLASLAAIWGFVAWAWVRPDPLEPVPPVEEIFRLAAGQSTLLAGRARLGCVVSGAAKRRRLAGRQDGGAGAGGASAGSSGRTGARSLPDPAGGPGAKSHPRRLAGRRSPLRRDGRRRADRPRPRQNPLRVRPGASGARVAPPFNVFCIQTMSTQRPCL